MRPFIDNHKNLLNACNKMQKNWDTFVKSLPKDDSFLKTAAQARMSAEKLFQKEPSKENQAKMDDALKKEIQEEEKFLLKQNIHNLGCGNFSDMVGAPVGALAIYGGRIGNFKEGLKNNDPEKMIAALAEFHDLQRKYAGRLEILQHALNNHLFDTGRINKKTLNNLKQWVNKAVTASKNLETLLEKTKWSVEADPSGWIRETGNAPKTQTPAGHRTLFPIQEKAITENLKSKKLIKENEEKIVKNYRSYLEDLKNEKPDKRTPEAKIKRARGFLNDLEKNSNGKHSTRRATPHRIIP